MYILNHKRIRHGPNLSKGMAHLLAMPRVVSGATERRLTEQVDPLVVSSILEILKHKLRLMRRLRNYVCVCVDFTSVTIMARSVIRR